MKRHLLPYNLDLVRQQELHAAIRWQVRELAATCRMFTVEQAAPLIPCHVEALRRFLRRHRADFPTVRRRNRTNRWVRVLSPREIRTIRRMMLGQVSATSTVGS